MLIGRTKNTAANPRPVSQEQSRRGGGIVRGSFLVEQRMAPRVPSRAETRRAFEEGRRSIVAVGEMQKETHTASETLSQVKNEAAQVKISIQNESLTLAKIKGKIVEAGKALKSVEVETRNEILSLEELKKKREYLNSSISRKTEDAIELEQTVALLKRETVDVVEKLNELSGILDDTEALKTKSLEEKADLEKRKKQLVEDVRKKQSELKDAEDKHQNVLGVISSATEDFRLFERRIAQFSEETGYLVGYQKLEK